jgi:hypothetical protein
MDKEKRKKFLEEVERLKEERKNRPKEEPKYPYELFGIECFLVELVVFLVAILFWVEGG